MVEDRRLFEVAFPGKQASLDSVEESNGRHGHVSTPHICRAGRALAVYHAAVIAEHRPDRDDNANRMQILEKMAGTVARKMESKKVGIEFLGRGVRAVRSGDATC